LGKKLLIMLISRKMFSSKCHLRTQKMLVLVNYCWLKVYEPIANI
jgi:hypothetical protein